ncbi:MAG: hypothetical protein ACRDBX_08465, partial [Erysipelotrichaceae bacterium]
MQQYEVLDFPIIKQQVAAYAKFSLGKAHVLALEPHFTKLHLQRELTLMRESLQFCIQYGDIPFGGVYDIAASLEKASKGIMLVPEELKYVAMHSHAVAQLHDHFQDNHLAPGALHDLVNTLQAHSEVAKEIDRCID